MQGNWEHWEALVRALGGTRKDNGRILGGTGTDWEGRGWSPDALGTHTLEDWGAPEATGSTGRLLGCSSGALGGTGTDWEALGGL